MDMWIYGYIILEEKVGSQLDICVNAAGGGAGGAKPGVLTSGIGRFRKC
jgi:hypothetical protein